MGWTCDAAKYTGIATVAPLLLTAFVKPKVTLGGRFRDSAIISAGLLIGFLLGCPGWVLAPAHYWAGLQYERAHAVVGHMGCFGIPVLGQLELIFRQDFLLLCLALLAFVTCIVQRVEKHSREISRSMIVLGGTAVATLLLSTLSKRQALQYLFTLYPAAAIAAGSLAYMFQRSRVLIPWTLSAGLVCAVFKLSVGFRSSALPPTYEVAKQWIAANIPSGAYIAIDWGHVPDLKAKEDIERRGKQFVSETAAALYESLGAYEIIPIEYTLEFLQSTNAEFLVVSSKCYRRFFSSGIFTALPPPPTSPLHEVYVRKRRFYSRLLAGASPFKLRRRIHTGNGPDILIFENTKGRRPHR